MPLRRVKRTLRHVDPISILKVSAFFYAIFLVIWLLFVALLYSILKSAGAFDAVHSFGREFKVHSAQQLHITLLWVEKWAFLFGLIMAVIASIVNVFLAFVYNFAADTVGGVELTFMEKDL